MNLHTALVHYGRYFKQFIGPKMLLLKILEIFFTGRSLQNIKKFTGNFFDKMKNVFREKSDFIISLRMC